MATAAKPKKQEKSEAAIRASLAEKAVREVRRNHEDEYQEILTRLCEEAGIPVRRRLTGEAGKLVRVKALADELGLALVPIGTPAPDVPVPADDHPATE